MATTKNRTAAKTIRKSAPSAVQDEVQAAVDWLKRHGTKRNRDSMARYAIPSERAFGVSMKDIQALV